MAAIFFADHCVPAMVVDDLRQAGYEVLVLKDHLPTASPDEVVIDEAGRFETVLTSLDGDFADIVRFPPPYHRKLGTNVTSSALRSRRNPVGSSQLP